MNLSLDRPIAFIDLETTGLNPSFDRIIEISSNGLVYLAHGLRE